MGTNDVPPPHITPYYLPVGSALLGTGGIGYTLCYYLMTRQSLRDRTYAMPLLSLAFNFACNFAWEIIFFAYVAEAPQEKTIFMIWMLLDIGLVYAVVKYGANEWTHAPIIRRNVGKILAVLVAWWCWALWAVSKWWIENNINPKPGKWYMGVEGPDTNELGYWTALVAQVLLSCASLAQIVVRGNSGGASYTIWACRFIGSVIGLNGNYVWAWWTWPEAHEYVANPFSVCLLVTWVVADVVYFFVLKEAKGTEAILEDGRKVARRAEHTAKTA